jgi:hypothetical protein
MARDFRDAITRAVQELERLEIIMSGRIEKSTKGRDQLFPSTFFLLERGCG